jgi:hypothetical protein
MNLDASIDELFELPPDRFTAARDRLAKQLREDGHMEPASTVKALRKPTLIAWALNQLSRRERPGLEALIASGDELRAAQRRALSGVEGASIRAAMEQRRKLVRQLTRRAVQILGEVGRGPQSADEEIARSLEAASTEPEEAEGLLQGRLTKPISGSSGFEAFSGLSLVAEAPGSEVVEGAERKARETELKNAERHAAKAEVDARRARVRADTLARDLEEIGRRSDEASREAERLEGDADEARRRLDTLRGRG